LTLIVFSSSESRCRSFASKSDRRPDRPFNVVSARSDDRKPPTHHHTTFRDVNASGLGRSSTIFHLPTTSGIGILWRIGNRKGRVRSKTFDRKSGLESTCQRRSMRDDDDVRVGRRSSQFEVAARSGNFTFCQDWKTPKIKKIKLKPSRYV